MKYKKSIILLALTIFVLLSISSVCASDVADATIASEEDSQIGLSQDTIIESDGVKSGGEDSPLTQTENDETLTSENTAEVLNVNEGNYSDLRNEIGDGGYKNLTKSYYRYAEGDGDTILINSSGVIDGKGAVIDMADSYIQAFVVKASDVTIKNLTIKNANFYDVGGAVYFFYNATIINCNFTNNSALNGGAIAFDGEGTLINCIFTDNTATGDGTHGGEGGAIVTFNCPMLNIDNCVFINNNAIAGIPNPEEPLWPSAGGAIDANTDVVINNSRFINNNASDGGALSFSWGTVVISNSNFTDNFASNGGAIENYNSNVAIERSTFDGNNADIAATICNDCEGILSVKNCIFAANVANNISVIYNELEGECIGKLTIENSTFKDNRVADNRTIYNEGHLKLAGNTIDHIIFNIGKITSPTNLTVLANKTLNVKYEETITLNATFTDDNGNLIKDENLKFTVEGAAQHIKSSYANGLYTANYKVDVVGQKAVSAVLGYDVAVKTATIIVDKVKTQLSANAITTIYNINKNLVITLKDSAGKAVPGVKLSVNLNGAKVYTTDSKGQVKVSTKGLAPKTYTAKITFNGDDNYLKSSKNVKVTVKKATPKLTAKAKAFKKSVKTKNYAVTLKTNQNKAMKNAWVTLKVSKKTYKVKTNKYGKATFKITNLKKKGTFKATVTFNGDKYYNKVIKKNVKIIVK